MFDIGWSELVLIGVVALVVIGPKELPTVLRAAGQWMAKLRRMASEFQGQFQEAMREAEMADLQKEVSEIATSAKSYAKDLESAFTDTPSDTTSTAQSAITTAAPAPEPSTPEPSVSEQPTSEQAMPESLLSAEQPAPVETPADTPAKPAGRIVITPKVPQPSGEGA